MSGIGVHHVKPTKNQEEAQKSTHIYQHKKQVKCAYKSNADKS